MIAPALLTAAGGSFILAGILRLLHHLYRRRHLAEWSWSWLAQGFYVVFGSMALWVIDHGAPSLLWAVVLVAALAAGYLQAALLMSGASEIQGEGRRMRPPRWLVAALAAGGALLALPVAFPGLVAGTVGPNAGFSAFLVFGPRALLLAPAFMVAALTMWRVDAWHHGIGRRLLGLGFLVYGLHQLQYLFVAFLALAGKRFEPYSASVGFVDVLLQFVVGLGIVIWFLEDEREEVVRTSRQIEHLAFHDPLTGLPNRKLFLDRLSQELSAAPRRGTQLAVMFLDVDRFKVINDSLGHGFGDELLAGVAQRLTEAVRRADTVARLGGDEFVLLVLDLQRRQDALAVGEKILDALRRPFRLHGHELYVSASLGVSVYPADGAEAEVLLKNADVAMYQAKDQGRDTVQMYSPTMSARALERLDLESDLRRALVEEEFEVYVQPVFSLASGELDGAEALIRWHHPGRGLLPPRDFLSLAELIGMSYELDMWVLRSACRRMARIEHRGGRLRLAVNLSARAFHHPNLPRLVEEVCLEESFDPSHLELEVTENLAMQNVEVTLSALKALKALGVRISIDDFGVGYSSLSYLRTFPIDTVKIDQSFIRSIGTGSGDTAIPRAVIAMARSLGLEVVAEGVESEHQLRFLLAERCHRVQGFFLGKPTPWRQLERERESRDRGARKLLRSLARDQRS